MLKHLPNILTGARILLAPAAAWCAWQYMDRSIVEGTGEARAAWAYWGAGLFVLAALTDLFDGWAARALKAESRLGRILDPIADKALVGLPLIALAVQMFRGGAPVWPAVAVCMLVIVGRDVGITLLRMLSPDGEGVRVSSLAKWKTALELIVVGAAFTLLALREWLSPSNGDLLPDMGGVIVWCGLLAVAAALSAWTGAAYLRPWATRK